MTQIKRIEKSFGDSLKTEPLDLDVFMELCEHDSTRYLTATIVVYVRIEILSNKNQNYC